MIPVFQTRTGTRELGNCLEACLASILELPISAIPDRKESLDVDAWEAAVDEARERGGDRAVGDLELDVTPWEAELELWLWDRGLRLLQVEIGRRLVLGQWLEIIGPGYWIGTHRTEYDSAHAIVYRGREVEHNPFRGVIGAEGLLELIEATALLAVNPPRLARMEPLPDVAGALENAIAELEPDPLWREKLSVSWGLKG